MGTKIQQTHADLIKAIADIAATMPLARTVQLYQFALFLKTHPLPTEETFEEIAADEAIWDTQFAATDDDKLAALVAVLEGEMNQDKVLPMFDEQGEFIEHQSDRKPARLLSGDCFGIQSAWIAEGRRGNVVLDWYARRV